jgi:hypothetical protein
MAHVGEWRGGFHSIPSAFASTSIMSRRTDPPSFAVLATTLARKPSSYTEMDVAAAAIASMALARQSSKKVRAVSKSSGGA